MTQDWRRSEPRHAERLAREFRRLQALGLGVALRGVAWIPGDRTDVEAEVVGNRVRVYVADPLAAIRALRHEVIHFEVAGCCAPYVRVLNRLLAAVNDEAYDRQERLADAIATLPEVRTSGQKPARRSVRTRE